MISHNGFLKFSKSRLNSLARHLYSMASRNANIMVERQQPSQCLPVVINRSNVIVYLVSLSGPYSVGICMQNYARLYGIENYTHKNTKTHTHTHIHACTNRMESISTMQESLWVMTTISATAAATVQNKHFRTYIGTRLHQPSIAYRLVNTNTLIRTARRRCLV